MRACPIDEVVERVLVATRAAAGEYGERWNWQREERKILKMCLSWLKKHPHLKAEQDRESASEGRDTADGGSDVEERDLRPSEELS